MRAFIFICNRSNLLVLNVLFDVSSAPAHQIVLQLVQVWLAELLRVQLIGIIFGKSAECK
jgi:hypothetical protein